MSLQVSKIRCSQTCAFAPEINFFHFFRIFLQGCGLTLLWDTVFLVDSAIAFAVVHGVVDEGSPNNQTACSDKVLPVLAQNGTSLLNSLLLIFLNMNRTQSQYDLRTPTLVSGISTIFTV